MKAFSIKQPWAWLISAGYMNMANIITKTSFRGEFYIHASKKIDKEGYDWVKRKMPDIPLPKKRKLKRNGIIGKATIIDCVTKCDSQWFTGPVALLLINAKQLPYIVCEGKRGFFEMESKEQ